MDITRLRYPCPTIILNGQCSASKGVIRKLAHSLSEHSIYNIFVLNGPRLMGATSPQDRKHSMTLWNGILQFCKGFKKKRQFSQIGRTDLFCQRSTTI